MFINRPNYISLTSYGDRVNTVSNVISSLKNQSSRVDKIILWLDQDEFSRESIPYELLSLEDDIFEVDFCPNYKSYKKLVPTLLKYPDVNVITFDDDILIPEGVIDAFINAHFDYPDAIIAARGRLMTKGEEGEFKNYTQWNLVDNVEIIQANDCILPIGYGGVLYPKNSLDQEVVNDKLFFSLADNADDIWFKCMGLMKRTPTIILPRKVSSNYKIIGGTQDSALYLNVNTGNRNLECLKKVAEHFSRLESIITSSFFDQILVSSKDLDVLMASPNIFKNKNHAVEVFRDVAISIEEDYPRLALRLMSLARKIRPKGPLINKKISQYENQIKTEADH